MKSMPTFFDYQPQEKEADTDDGTLFADRTGKFDKGRK